MSYDERLNLRARMIAEYFGLYEDEAKLYLGLLRLGVAGASKLSVACDVPRTMIYNTLKKLIDLGLIVEVPGRPKRFKALDPEISL